MPVVTFQVIEGIDKGRVFREMDTPVTIGREEGNVLRLNDERISRYHAKVQHDNGEIILTDLESTNGTRVNGNVITIRRIRPGDRIGVGRSLLLFGSDADIAARIATMTGVSAPAGGLGTSISATIPANGLGLPLDEEMDFAVGPNDKITVANGNVFVNNRPLPPLPQKMTPSQAARFSELLEFLHRQLTQATENIFAPEEATQVTLSFVDWQRVMALQMLLARYIRAVSDPDSLEG